MMSNSQASNGSRSDAGIAQPGRNNKSTNPINIMKRTMAKGIKANSTESHDADAIALYADSQTAAHAAICRMLHKEIRDALPGAASKIWHAFPVWFVGENPVVGYKATSKHVNLLFWSGQSFDEPDLKPAGKFKAAQIQFTDTSQIDAKPLRRWLKKAAENIWDYKSICKRR